MLSISSYLSSKVLIGTPISDPGVGGVQVGIITELHWWASWQCLLYFRMDIPAHPAILLLGICSMEIPKWNRHV